MFAHLLGPVYLGVKLGFLDSCVTDLPHCFMLCWQQDKIPEKKMRTGWVIFWSEASDCDALDQGLAGGLWGVF
jgi:hypothetical protein